MMLAVLSSPKHIFDHHDICHLFSPTGSCVPMKSDLKSPRILFHAFNSFPHLRSVTSTLPVHMVACPGSPIHWVLWSSCLLSESQSYLLFGVFHPRSLPVCLLPAVPVWCEDDSWWEEKEMCCIRGWHVSQKNVSDVDEQLLWSP